MDPLPDLNVAVDPYLPDCLQGRLDNEFEEDAALKFDPASFNYYKVSEIGVDVYAFPKQKSFPSCFINICLLPRLFQHISDRGLALRYCWLGLCLSCSHIVHNDVDLDFSQLLPLLHMPLP
jgi:hypothetical protein